MNLLLPLIVLVILAVLYAGSLNNPRTRLIIVVVILGIVLVLCWLELRSPKLEGFSGVSGYAPLNYIMRVDDGVGASSDSSYDGINYMNFNSQISPLGTYDGIRLPSKIDTAPLMNKVFITSPVGDDIQLTEDPSSKNFPSIDGTPNGEKHLFLFAKNNYGGTCHSQYSSDRGMVCVSPEQVKLLQGRAGNLTAPQEYPGM